VTGTRSIPRRLVLLGGGPVGAEMAQAVRRLGGEVAPVDAAGPTACRPPSAATCRVYVRKPDGSPVRDSVSVAIDITNVRFS
jgi:hypothetical protein